MTAVTVPRCTPASHDAIKASAPAFAAGTRFIGSDPVSDCVLGNCLACGSTLAYPLVDWRDADTQPAGDAP